MSIVLSLIISSASGTNTQTFGGVFDSISSCERFGTSLSKSIEEKDDTAKVNFICEVR